MFVGSLVVFGALGSIWALSTPLGASPDEPVHVMRAASVVRGDAGGRSVATPSPGAGIMSAVDYPVTIPQSYAESYLFAACYVFQPDVTADCQPPANTSETPTTTSIYVGSYPPLYYAIVGGPSLVWPADPGIYAMRILSVLLGSTLLSCGVVCARRVDRLGGGSGFVFVGVALAVTPMAIFLMATVNPSGFEVTSAFAAWWGGLALVRAARARSVSRADVALCAVPGMALAWSRPTGLVVLAAIVATVAVFEADKTSLLTLVGDRRVVVAGAAMVVVVLGAAVWSVEAKSLSSFIGAPEPGISKLDAAWRSIQRLPDQAGQMIGRFGWLDTPLPRPALWAWGAAVVALLVSGLWLARWRQRLGIALAIVATIGISTTSEALRAEELGFIWQGRYSLPLAIGIPVLAAVAIGDSRRVTGRLRTVVLVATVAIVPYGQLLAHLASARRYATGVSSPLLAFLTSSTWQPPLPLWVLLALVGAAVAAYGAWLVLLVNRSSEARD